MYSCCLSRRILIHVTVGKRVNNFPRLAVFATYSLAAPCSIVDYLVPKFAFSVHKSAPTLEYRGLAHDGNHYFGPVRQFSRNLLEIKANLFLPWRLYRSLPPPESSPSRPLSPQRSGFSHNGTRAIQPAKPAPSLRPWPSRREVCRRNSRK